MLKVRIGNRVVTEKGPVFVIAEAGVNHNGNVGLGKKLIDAAVRAGADAVKFQTFKADNIVIKNAPKARYHIETTGSKQSFRDLLKSQELSLKDHKVLKSYARKKGIIFMSTPYDEDSVDLLEKAKVRSYKISATDLTNIPLIRYIAKKGKPVILSTGMATLSEVDYAFNTLKKKIGKQIIILHCYASYPAPVEGINLKVMETLRKRYGVLVGYSDHTEGVDVPSYAVTMGARVIEKHFTIDKKLPGPDHRMSVDPIELKEMIKRIRHVEMLMGNSKKTITGIEKRNRSVLRKSVVAKIDIPKGKKITAQMLAVKRPGTGINPNDIDSLTGMVAVCNIEADTLISWKQLKGKSKR